MEKNITKSKSKNKKSIKYIVIISIFILLFLAIYFYTIKDKTKSPYIGQEFREIKSLSPEDIIGLKKGAGTPFGGMAKLGELNGYPGPKHIIEFLDEEKFSISEDKEKKVRIIFKKMLNLTIPLGNEIIDIERNLNKLFQNKTITEEILERDVKKVGELYGELRFIHLQTHLKMIDILSIDEIKIYNNLRGYNTGEDPCLNIPEGHDSELYKSHNNCE